MTKEWSMGDLLSTSSAYWKGCALQAAVRLGVFTVLHDRRLRLAEVARAIEADERGAEFLLNALAAMGLLEKDSDLYSNTAPANQFLARQSGEYMGHIILHHHHILDGWAQLDRAVRTGAPVKKRSYGEEVERESFLLGMFNLARGTAPLVAGQVDLAGRRRLLDLGGGPGTYAIHFCLANPGLAALIYDRPTTEPFALQTVDRFGLGDRISFVGGDFNEDPVSGGPYDAAWLSHILHSNGPDECRALLGKTVDAMEPGGLIMIHEFILEDTKDAPEFAALFSLNMLVNNPAGRAYCRAEIEDMLTGAGVGEISLMPFRGPNDSAVMIGTV